LNVAIKILAVLFALIAVRRVVARYRRRGGLTLEFVLWLLVFSGIGVVVFIPHKTDEVARWLGVSSGFNALTFMAITALLYAVYRLVSRIHVVERDVTRLVRALALATAARAANGDAPADESPPATTLPPGKPPAS
jgi:hypothetical protein